MLERRPPPCAPRAPAGILNLPLIFSTKDRQPLIAIFPASAV